MVPNVPFYLSQAAQEFGGDGYASTILSRAATPAPRLLSTLALAVKFSMLTLITTNQSPYMYFTFDGTHTIYHHNNDGVQQAQQIQKGQLWIKLGPPTSQANFENCSQGQWFLADGTLRGLRKYQQGVAAFEIYMSWSNGGPSIREPVCALNWP